MRQVSRRRRYDCYSFHFISSYIVWRIWLYASFSQWIVLRDVFIPNKKDTKGRAFTFIKTVNGSQAKGAVVSFNGVVVSGKKLLVQAAQFGRESVGGDKGQVGR